MHPVMQNGKEISKQGAKRKVDGSLHRHGENPDGSSFDAYSKVSEDGASITDEITVRGKDSNESKEKFVYHRVMGKTGAGANVSKPPRAPCVALALAVSGANVTRSSVEAMAVS